MDVERAIGGTLRVVRDFSDQPIPDEALSAILEAARRTGSSASTCSASAIPPTRPT